jgi:hypothetical protein
MADNIDEIAKSLQESVLECYSQRLKHELLDSKNIGKIENTDSHASITGVCSVLYLPEMPLAYRRHVRRYTGLDVEFGIF